MSKGIHWRYMTKEQREAYNKRYDKVDFSKKEPVKPPKASPSKLRGRKVKDG